MIYTSQTRPGIRNYNYFKYYLYKPPVLKQAALFDPRCGKVSFLRYRKWWIVFENILLFYSAGYWSDEAQGKPLFGKLKWDPEDNKQVT